MTRTAKSVDSVGHFLTVLAVLGSATYLAAAHVIQADAITTVYGVALGFTGGAVAARRATASSSPSTTESE